MILKIFVSGMLNTNSMLLICKETKKAAVIDPANGSFKEILSFAEKEGLQIESIFLTHSHFDHIGDVSKIKEKTNAKVYIHKLDKEGIERPGSDGLPIFEKIKGVKVECLLEDGDRLTVGKIKIEVLHTPGHTPGSVCYYIAEENVLLSGDTLFAGCMGKIDLATSKPDLMWSSLKKLSSLPKETKVYPGHGRNTTIGKESWLDRAKELYGY